MYTIALVEDNADNRLLVQAILDEKYTIIEYVNGFEAVARIPGDKVDLILMDISMPGMDGELALVKLRAIDGYVVPPVIALTTHAMSGDAIRFHAAGFDAYITKPIIDEHVLLGTISSFLNDGVNK